MVCRGRRRLLAFAHGRITSGRSLGPAFHPYAYVGAYLNQIIQDFPGHGFYFTRKGSQTRSFLSEEDIVYGVFLELYHLVLLGGYLEIDDILVGVTASVPGNADNPGICWTQALSPEYFQYSGVHGAQADEIRIFSLDWHVKLCPDPAGCYGLPG